MLRFIWTEASCAALVRLLEYLSEEISAALGDESLSEGSLNASPASWQAGNYLMTRFTRARQSLRISRDTKARRRMTSSYLHCPAPGQNYAFKNSKVLGETVSAILGQGRVRPVVFLHGNSSSMRSGHISSTLCIVRDALYLPQICRVTANRRTHPRHGVPIACPDISAVVSGLLDVLQWDCVDVVGWSLGGHIGLQLLATDARVNSLLVVGTPPVPVCAKSLHQAFYASADMDLAGKPNFSHDDALLMDWR